MWYELLNKSMAFSAKQQCEITSFGLLITTGVYNRRSLILFFLFNGMHTNPVVAYFGNIIKCEQDGTIANSHNWAGVYFQVTFSLPSRSSLLSSLMSIPALFNVRNPLVSLTPFCKTCMDVFANTLEDHYLTDLKWSKFLRHSLNMRLLLEHHNIPIRLQLT